MKLTDREAEKLIVGILNQIGEDPEREGLTETPARVVKSWAELFSGYKVDIHDLMSKAFVEGACHEMVVLRDIEVCSMCEHHMLPFIGKAHIGYIPNGKVIGVSKLSRLVRAFSQRLQIQEKLTAQIADALLEGSNALGVMVVIEAQHFCMKMRGVKESDSVMETLAIRGLFENASTRQEFLSRINRG
jgi:GTP cyclohydrolase I